MNLGITNSFDLIKNFTGVLNTDNAIKFLVHRQDMKERFLALVMQDGIYIADKEGEYQKCRVREAAEYLGGDSIDECESILKNLLSIAKKLD